jgi:nitric oxide reductase subunit B
VAMTLALAVAGITQVYLERMVGMDFLAVQRELEVHFVGVLLAALLFVSGVAAFVIDFVRYGLPVSDPADLPAEDDQAASAGQPAAQGA